MSKTDRNGNNFEKKASSESALETLNETIAEFKHTFHQDLIFDKTVAFKMYFYLIVSEWNISR